MVLLYAANQIAADFSVDSSGASAEKKSLVETSDRAVHVGTRYDAACVATGDSCGRIGLPPVSSRLMVITTDSARNSALSMIHFFH